MRLVIYLMFSLGAVLLPATTYGQEDCSRALIRDNVQSFTTDRERAAALQLMTFEDYKQIAQSQGGGGGFSYGANKIRQGLPYDGRVGSAGKFDNIIANLE